VAKGHPAPTHPGFSPETLRAAIRGRAAVPSDMLQAALQKAKDQLNAKERKFFAHQGMIMDQRDVDAHAIQQGAARLIIEMSELLIKAPPKQPEGKITVTIDPKTGVMRLVIGDDDALDEAIATEQPQIIEGEAETLEEEVEDHEGELEFVKLARNAGKLDPAVRQALGFADPVVGNGEGQPSTP
jgi:hypothetical protein